MAESTPLYLVDGSGFIFRAFHALPPLTAPDGTPTNAVYGYCQMLAKLTQDLGATTLAVIFDAGSKTFRNEFFPEYKAHRPEPPAELVPQFKLIREATRAFNLPCLELDGYEADDLIAAYAKAAVAAGRPVTIVSSDKDLMQLIRDGVEMYDPIKFKRIGAAEVQERFGVPPEKVIDVQALTGDPTDNVPGVPGIGVKTAAQLITEYGDLDTLLAKAEQIKQPKRRETLLANREKALISRKLVTLDADTPLPEPIEALALKPPEREVLLGFFQRMGFTRLLAKLDAAPAAAAAAPAAPGALAAVAAAKPNLIEQRYELVQSLERLETWIRRANETGAVALDVETDGPDPTRATLIGISLALQPGEACYIPLAHRPSGGILALDAPPPQIPVAQALAALKPLLEDPAVLKIGHDVKYDSIVLAHAARAAKLTLDVAPIDDPMLLSFALDAGRHGHERAELAEKHLEFRTPSHDEATGTGKARLPFAEVPLDKALACAAGNVDATLRLQRELKPRLLRERMVTVYETMDRPLTPVLADMETAGIRVDPDTLRRLSNEFGKSMARLEAEIHGLAGRSFNVGSPKQLGEILFDELKLPGGRKGKTGAYSTHSDVLEELSEHHALPQKILDWRQVSKLKSTYADALVEQKIGRAHV